MDENKYYLAIGATILVMAFIFFKDKKHTSRKASVHENSEIEMSAEGNTQSQAPVKLGQPSQAYGGTANPETTTPVAAANPQQEQVMLRFSENLQTMAKCLELNKSTLQADGKLEPTPQNLLNQLRNALGDVVVEMDDWSQTEIVEDGSKKRVRIDYEYPDGANPVKRLSIYKINQYGMPEIVNLRNEEMNDPNESYIQSLIEGRQILTEEKGRRGYFTDGEEVIYSQKNGQLANVSVTRGIRNFSCYNLSDLGSNCVCQ